ncbi:MAG: PASTA domain-containing protein [Clostridia bacterium]|nr:PASTA domain-containing protein [Clostridia bacterium]
MNAPTPTKSMIGRSVLVAAVFCVLLVVGMGGMLFYHQIIKHDFYETRALEQQTLDQIITPARGTIYASDMQKLAYSVPCYTVVLSPATMKDEQVERVASELAVILDLDREWILQKTQNKKSYYQVIKKKVDTETCELIRTFISTEKIKGIHLFEDTERYYPYGTLAANVIGFTTVDNVGAYGLEAAYEDMLSGTPGRITTSKNGAGTALSSAYEQYFDAEDGISPVTTIDIPIQQILEKYLKKAYEDNKCAVGTIGIVMNVKTGEVLGMGQYPTYDLNDPRSVWDEKVLAELETITDEEERETAESAALFEQWSTRPVSLTYEPGSVFKLVTTAIALEEGAVSLSDTFSCPGYKYIGTQRVACWKAGGHGGENFLDGLKNSCNPVFMETALRVGTEKYYEYLHTMGLADKTDIDLQGEQTGILHSKSNFRELELAIASFGQRFKVTPIRLLTTICGLVNGGKMMQPHLVKAIADKDGNIIETVEPTMISQIVSASTSETLCYMMEQVVSTGTGKNAYVAGYRVGGKTGTSEKLDAVLEEGETESDKRIASFCGVAPMDDPEIAVLVLIDEPRGSLRQGGQIAAPVVGNILSEVLPYWGIDPVYTEEELAKAQVSVPAVTGNSVSVAENKLKRAGFRVRVIGQGTTVTTQMPAAGADIAKDSTILLYCGEAADTEALTMPSLTGMSYDQVRLKLDSMGLYLHAQGALQSSGDSATRATSQSVRAGDSVQVGTVVNVQFADLENTADH